MTDYKTAKPIKSFDEIAEAITKKAGTAPAAAPAPTPAPALTRNREMVDVHPFFDLAVELCGVAALADKVGYSRSALQNIVNGHRGVAKTLEVACKAVVMEKDGAAFPTPPKRHEVYLLRGAPSDERIAALLVTARSLGVNVTMVE